jgi:KDO2-lipid IV(A) lauroyltransferase
MPELDGPEVERIVCGMWENFGRVIAEYPHLGRHALWAESGRIDIVGREHIGQAVGSDTARIFFSGHLANWELMPIAAAQSDVPLRLIYRAPNNPWIDGLIGRLRSRYHRGLIPKGAAGARQAVGTLKAKENLGLVVDQKMNDGIAVPFFGRPAMTAPALIDLARRYDAAVYPVRIERRNGARFRVTVMPPVPVPNTADRHADLVAGMTDVNRILEGWIRAAPEQWLWLHRRWPES